MYNYKLDPTAVCTFNSVNLNEGQGFDIQDGGSVVAGQSQGSPFVDALWIDGQTATISFTSKDVGLLNNAGLKVGATGALVLKGAQRAANGPDISAVKMTVTATHAMVTGVAPKVGSTGDSELTINFQTYGGLLAYSVA